VDDKKKPTNLPDEKHEASEEELKEVAGGISSEPVYNQANLEGGLSNLQGGPRNLLNQLPILPLGGR
jgi:hypothetical protein